MEKGLFVVNGMGLGNATRSAVFINQLKTMYSLDVATSGAALKYFQESPDFRLITMKEILLRSRDQNVSVIKSILLLPLCILNFLRNALVIMKLITENRYRFIVIDSDYTLILWKWFYSGPVFALNNSIWTIDCPKSLTPRNIFSKIHYHIERFDYLFHTKLVDHAFCPTPIKIVKKTESNFSYVQPLTRTLSKSYQPTPTSMPHVLVIPSGSGCGLSGALISRLSSLKNVHFHIVNLQLEEQPNFTVYPFQKDLSTLYDKCDFVLSNSGWSTVCEIIDYGKIGFILPIENHTEQIANSIFVQDLPNIHIVNRNNFLEVIAKETKLAPLKKKEAIIVASSMPISELPSARSLLIQHLQSNPT